MELDAGGQGMTAGQGRSDEKGNEERTISDRITGSSSGIHGRDQCGRQEVITIKGRFQKKNSRIYNTRQRFRGEPECEAVQAGRGFSGQEGSTIVSVMAAFVLLLMGISMFYTAVTVSAKLQRDAANLNLVEQNALETFYEKGYGDTQENTGTTYPYITLKEKNGSDSIQVRAAHREVEMEITVDRDGETEEYPFKLYYYTK